MLQKIKSWIAKVHKSPAFNALSVSMCVAMVAAMGCICAFAEGETVSSETAITNSLNTMMSTIGDKVLDFVASALPIAGGVVAVIVAVRFGMNFFFNLIHKA